MHCSLGQLSDHQLDLCASLRYVVLSACVICNGITGRWEAIISLPRCASVHACGPAAMSALIIALQTCACDVYTTECQQQLKD